MSRLACVLVVLLAAPAARAQDLDGHFSTLFMVMPDVGPERGRQSVGELRARLFAESNLDPHESWHVRAGVFVDGLVGGRDALGAGGVAADAIVRPADLFLEFRGERVDLRVGMSRIVWGRLDEFQPTDVVNPLDLSRFLLEGRSDARLSVGLVRGRVFLPRGGAVEAIVVPVFRSGRFDQLDERSSPFALAPPGAIERREPGASWSNLQGGARLTSTVRRVDWALAVWRGFEPFPTYLPLVLPVDPAAPVPARLAAVFPRFTMIGGDFETVRGAWGLRGEGAWFRGAAPRSFEGGVGADRRAGNYRVSLNAVVTRADDTEVSLVGWAERSFALQTRTARLLAVYDPADDTAFIRAIAAWTVRDDVAIEGSAGWFTGDAGGASAAGIDVLALLARRDFLYARLKVYF